MQVVNFEQFELNQAVRFYGQDRENEPIGHICNIDPVSQHITVEWQDGYEPMVLDALSAMRKLETL